MRVTRGGSIAFILVAVAGLPIMKSGVMAEELRKASMPPPSSITQIVPPASFPTGSRVPRTRKPFGPNARVNSHPETLLRPQVEPSITSSPLTNRLLVAGFSDALDDSLASDFAPGIARSENGGFSWSAPSGGPILPDPPGFIWGNRTLATYLAAGDSAVAWALDDSVYFSTLGFHDNTMPPDDDCASGGLYVYRSDDAGDTWTLPAQGPAIPNTQTVFRDKEYIAADHRPASPFAGNVYLVWDDDIYGACPQDFSNNFVERRISFSSSSNGGATWSTQIDLANGCLAAPVPAVGPDGAIYVAWYDCNVGVRQMVRKSNDGGVTFEPAVAAASNLVPPPNPLPGSQFRVNAAFPAIAADPKRKDNVYITWSSDNGPNQTDVFVVRSLDGGESWSPAVRVNDDPNGNPRDQFFPWIAVSPNGVVAVTWGDDRLDGENPGGKLYDIFMAISKDEGATFSRNIRASTMSSDPDFDGFGGTFIGDYFGLSSSGVPAWGDTRELNQNIFGVSRPTCTTCIGTE